VAIQTFDELSPETRQVVDEFFSLVASRLRASGKDVADETLQELGADLLSALHFDSSPEQARALTTRYGDPSSFGETTDSSQSRAVGNLLGVPYDIRVPTVERIISLWWNPRNPHVLVPRVFGLGWDLNFGAIVIRLHLIAPDSEDEPFGMVSDRAFATALCVPLVLTTALAVSFVLLRTDLPEQLPSHWNLAGHVDSLWPATRAFLFLFVPAVVSTAWAIWSVVTRRHAVTRGATVGFASFTSGLASGVWALTVITTMGGAQTWWLPPVSILSTLLVPLAVFVSLARVGRAAEQRRDLTQARSRKGSQ
jgi:Protein of unknown function (DUF1648)/Family of unknown function (DUF5808)